VMPLVSIEASIVTDSVMKSSPSVRVIMFWPDGRSKTIVSGSIVALAAFIPSRSVVTWDLNQ
jgi:hypothetical protein